MQPAVEFNILLSEMLSHNREHYVYSGGPLQTIQLTNIMACIYLVNPQWVFYEQTQNAYFLDTPWSYFILSFPIVKDSTGPLYLV